MRVSPRRRTGWPCPHQAEWSAFEVDPNRETTVRKTRAGGAWIRRRASLVQAREAGRAEYVSKVDADAEHTNGPSRMIRPRIFLGSSGKQAKLLQAITRGLADVADVEPWTTTFNPGRSTLDRLVELSQEVDFAAFVFAEDDWTTTDASRSGQASPRDNVVFEAGLFGGALGIRRTFILHASGSKLPTDLLGLTTVRYDTAGGATEVPVDQPEAPQGNRDRGSPRSGRGAVVAALAHRAERGRAVGGEPPAHLARPRRWPQRDRPCLAGGRHALSPLLERGCEGAQGSGRHPLLLEGRASSAPECPAARGHRRDPGGDRRPRQRVLDDTVGSRSRAECPNRRYLPSSRPRTSRCSTAGARRSAPGSSRSACRSGSRPRTRSERGP